MNWACGDNAATSFRFLRIVRSAMNGLDGWEMREFFGAQVPITLTSMPSHINSCLMSRMLRSPQAPSRISLRILLDLIPERLGGAMLESSSLMQHGCNTETNALWNAPGRRCSDGWTSYPSTIPAISVRMQLETTMATGWLRTRIRP